MLGFGSDGKQANTRYPIHSDKSSEENSGSNMAGDRLHSPANCVLGEQLGADCGEQTSLAMFLTFICSTEFNVNWVVGSNLRFLGTILGSGLDESFRAFESRDDTEVMYCGSSADIFIRVYFINQNPSLIGN
jgi:hypothetical protein